MNLRALSAGVLLFFAASAAMATVTTSVRSIEYSPSVDTSVFAITFPVLSLDHLKVTKTLKSSGAATILVRGQGYTAVLPVGATNGSVTTTSPVTSLYRLKIERVVPLTQTVSLRSQGTYSASVHESIADKLTMITQQLTASAGTDGQAAVDTHVGQADPHAGYALLAGRAGGQNLKGGTAASETLTLSSTAHATKGKVVLGSDGTELVVDDVNNRVGVGTATPSVALDVVGAGMFSTSLASPALYGSETTAGSLTLHGNDAGDNTGFVWLGTKASFRMSNGYLRLGDTTDPGTTYALQVPSLASLLGTVIIGNTGHIGKQNDTFGLYLSGGTQDAGTDDAGAIFFGSAHATKAGQSELYGSTIKTLSVAGVVNATFTNGATASSSSEVFAGQLAAPARMIYHPASPYTVQVPADCGATIVLDAAETVVLPVADNTNAGCVVTVYNETAAVVSTVSPNVNDGIGGNCKARVTVFTKNLNTACNTTCAVSSAWPVHSWNEASGYEVTVSPSDATADGCECQGRYFSGVVNKPVLTVGATSIAGDHITIVSSGVTGASAWLTKECAGEFYSTP